VWGRRRERSTGASELGSRKRPLQGGCYNRMVPFGMRTNPAALALAVGLFAAESAAQEQPRHIERLELRITSVDVVVTDRAGNPILGLTPADFVLLEKGQQREITNFHEVRGGRPHQPDEGDLEPEVVEQQRRRIIFFVDRYSIDHRGRIKALAALAKQIGSIMRPDDEASVVAWRRGLRVETTLSRDPQAVLAALATLVDAGPGTFVQERRSSIMAIDGFLDDARQRGSQCTIPCAFERAITTARNYSQMVRHDTNNLLRDLELVMKSAAGTKGRRIVVFIGQHLPALPALEVFQHIDTIFAPHAADIRGKTPPVLTAMQDPNFRPQESLARVANALGFTLYFIHAGAQGSEATPAERNRSIDPQFDFAEFSNSAASMGELAQRTGGIALSGSENYDLVVQTISSDLGHYYSLGFRGNDSEGEKLIEVRTRDDSLVVRSRRSYVIRSDKEERSDAVLAAAVHGHSAGGENHDFEISITLGHGTHRLRRQRVPVEIRIPAAAITLLPEGDQMTGGFHVIISAYDGKGEVAPATEQYQSVRLSPAQAEAIVRSGYHYTLEVELRRGENRVAVGVIDEISGRRGVAVADAIR
jgi:VWFA-related protein